MPLQAAALKSWSSAVVGGGGGEQQGRLSEKLKVLRGVCGVWRVACGVWCVVFGGACVVLRVFVHMPPQEGAGPEQWDPLTGSLSDSTRNQSPGWG